MHSSWEEFQVYIQDPEIIHQHEELLATLGIPPARLTARELLTCHGMPYLDNIPHVLAEAAVAVAKELTGMSGCCPTTIQEFATQYRRWKDRDAQEVLETLCRMYWEYELILALTHDMQPEDVSHAREQQAECLRLMDGMDRQAYFRAYNPLVVSPDTRDAVYSTLKRAFWDHVQEAAAGGDIGPLMTAFRDMKDMLTRIVRGRRGEEILAEVEDVFDEAFITERHAQQPEMDPVFWIQRCQCLRAILLQLDAPVHDAVTQAAPLESLQDCWAFLAYVMDRLHELSLLE